MSNETQTGFFAELKRRNVFRVGIAYLVIAWLTLQIVDVLVPILDLPETAGKLVFLLLVVGLPIALIFAWAFEMTPEGLKREKDVDRSTSIRPQTGRKLDFAIIGILTVALGFSLYLHWGDDEHAVEVDDENPEIVATEGRQSIAVLPFANRSAIADDEFFVDGVHDDLLTKLAKISALKVISRTSVMQYRGTEKNMRTIGEELGVKTLLEGGIQRAGDQVRINVQLIDATTDEHLWAETYNMQLTAANIFEIQERISTEITTALKTTLSPEEKNQLAARPTQNLEAYEAYLLGRQTMRTRTSEKVNAAIGEFRRAAELDDEFALAFVGLAEATMILNTYGGLGKSEMLDIAGQAVARAFELDDQSGEAYTVRGGLQEYTGQLAEAERDYLRAIELAPSFTTAYHWYGLILMNSLGEADKAEDIFRQAVELDPLAANIRANHAFALHALGRNGQATEEAKRALEIEPGQPDALGFFLYFNTWVAGDLAEAVRWGNRLMIADPVQSHMMAYAYLALGDIDTAKIWMNIAQTRFPDNANANPVNAILHLAQSEVELAGMIANDALKNSGDNYWSVRNLEILASTATHRDAYAEGIDVITEFWPGLAESRPDINASNARNAISLAALMIGGGGDAEKANRMLLTSREILRDLPIQGEYGAGYSRAAIHALLSEKPEALAELRNTINSGWRGYWIDLPHLDLKFAALHGDPDFEALMDEVKKLIADDLRRVRAMEEAGGIPRPPQ